MGYSKCQNCGGEQIFKPETGMLYCERCGSTFPVNEPDKKVIRKVYSPTFTVTHEEATQYQCETCGARMVTGQSGDLKRCSSCGNLSLKKVVDRHACPEGIIPFSLSRKRAAEIFRDWVSSRKFAPSDLKTMAKLEKISGLYVPVWDFNFVSVWSYSAIGVKRRVDSEGNNDIREYPVQKIKDTIHSDVIRSGSTKISDDFIEGVGNYDFKDLRPYSTDYLLGFAGLETDIDIHKTFSNITSDISGSNESRAKQRLSSDYDYYKSFSCRTRFKDVSFNYCYVPVWANHYTYKGKLYHCYINGQTGKASGKAPKSFFKISGLVCGILGAIAAAVLLVLKFVL